MIISWVNTIEQNTGELSTLAGELEWPALALGIEVVKIQVALAFWDFMHQFQNYSYLILKGLQNYVPIGYVKIITSKIISQYTCDNSHALEHGWTVANIGSIETKEQCCGSLVSILPISLFDNCVCSIIGFYPRSNIQKYGILRRLIGSINIWADCCSQCNRITYSYLNYIEHISILWENYIFTCV